MKSLKILRRHVLECAADLLVRKAFLSPLDVLMEMGFLNFGHIHDWEMGKTSYLEQIIENDIQKVNCVLKWIRQWAIQKGLKPKEVNYTLKSNNGTNRSLDFTKKGFPKCELAYRIHYLLPRLSKEKQEPPPPEIPSTNLIVLRLTAHSQCSQCQKSLIRGSLCFMERAHPLCVSCGDGKISPFSRLKSR
ncbi:MAG: hypothetical protein ACD_16C00248G0001 [uncultured bacterium]|nr:MAG: hypothetical protein ACD_16C00248G0001 [uncultured bacterium]